MSVSAQDQLKGASIATAGEMRDAARSLAQTSMLSVLEIDELIEDVSDLVPAGNVPNLILDGLARLQEQSPPPDHVQRDMKMMFRGVGQMLDAASYRMLVAVPARVILSYQKLMTLAGKDPDSAFPDGTWQFYVDYALREDSARHTNETHGFDTALRQTGIHLSDVDRMTAWVMTAIHTLHSYDDLLENEWRERVYSRLLMHLRDDEDHHTQFRFVYRDWQRIMPYRRMGDAHADEDYAAYRHRIFDEFFMDYIRQLSPDLQQMWLQNVQVAKTQDLPRYLNQMSILGYLNPDAHSETHEQLNLEDLHIGLVLGGRYYLIPACVEGSTEPTDFHDVRAMIQTILTAPAGHPPTDMTDFARVRRTEWAGLHKKLPKEFVQELNALRLAPMILNFDPRNSHEPLAKIRQAERGIGDHALTIFDTRETFCFDQSHIYFDGAGGAALAEIMTNEALGWANYLQQLPPPSAGTHRPYSPELNVDQKIQKILQKTTQSPYEIGAETDIVHLKKILQLRKYFKMRSDLLALTVNDLLVLYRAIHGMVYKPDAEIIAQLLKLRSNDYTRDAAEAALVAMEPLKRSPATLIPVDASFRSPRDRLYPMTLEVPLDELNLMELHDQVMKALVLHEQGSSSKPFNELQRQYLAALAGFGAVMSQAKVIANEGETGSVNSIKMLANLPPPLQRLLDAIPGRWDVFNDIIKGREVFSNVGQVAKTSTLTRFITAKDDNDKKTLAWGVITDAQSTMRISLRDFRPHVGMLINIGQPQLAEAITQHYLDTYASGLNEFINDLTQITRKSPQTTILE